ncbi:MAG: hypothetical protein HZY73_11270 [Micropruina sp.]|nr:MAG: hypothetical protein HZY73_11270 [Micropruina sp.]
MALTKAAIRKARAVRIALAAAVDATTAALTLAWASAWEEIVAEWAAAVDELLVLGAGEWPTRAQISRATRATNALRVTAERLSELAKRSGVTISGDMQTIVRAAGEWERGVITTQLPTGISFSWAEVDETALDAIVKRSTGRIESSLRPLPREQSAVMRHTLIRGVAVGDNPNAVASLMLKRLRGFSTVGWSGPG